MVCYNLRDTPYALCYNEGETTRVRAALATMDKRSLGK